MIKKILLDTDMGSDIDDAVALTYLLCHPECDLLGITTVSSNPVGRAMMTDAICKAHGRDIPIHPGMDDPMCIDQLKKQWRLLKYLDRWPHRTTFGDLHAVEFLNRTIRKYPGEITLIPIGPLSNIGMLFKLYPDIPSLLKGVVLMGGTYKHVNPEKPEASWNFVCDPHAADIVFKARLPMHRSVGDEVTRQVFLDEKQFMENFSSGVLEIIGDFARAWFAEKVVSKFHDPLAVSTVFNGDICEFERGNVQIDYQGGRDCISLFEPDPNGRHEIAASVDSKKFFDDYFEITKR